MEIGDESGFVSKLAWGVSSEDLDKVMLEVKTNYFLQLDEESTILVEENRKLGFVYLSGMKERCKEDKELLNKIAEFYGNHHYPEDMVYRLDKFLKLESVRFS